MRKNKVTTTAKTKSVAFIKRYYYYVESVLEASEYEMELGKAHIQDIAIHLRLLHFQST